MIDNNPSEQTINVTDSLGKTGSLPLSQAREAINSGQYRAANLDEVKAAKNEQMFGGLAKEIYSTALGAARTATLGGSDLLFTNLPHEFGGLSPEELRGFSETNPVATGIGEVAGVLRDPFGIGKLINKAGGAVGAGASKAIKAMGDAEDASAVTRTLLNAAPGIVQHGLEGAAIGGIANSVNDYALGDPSLNSEKILSNVGWGALIGGGTGGAFKALGFGLTPALRKATDALGKVRDDLIGSGYGEEALISKVLPQRFSEAVTDRQLNLDTKGQAANLRKIVTNLNDVVDNVTGELDNFKSEMDPKAMSALWKRSAKLAGDAQTQVAQNLSDIVDKMKLMIPEGELKNTLESLKNKSKFGTFWGGSTEQIFNALKSLKTNIGELIEKEPNLEDSFRPVDQAIGDSLKDPSLFGPAGSGLALHEENTTQFEKFISSSGNLTPFQKLFGEVENGKWRFDIGKMHQAFSEEDPLLKEKSLQMLDDFFSHLKEMPENLLNARRAVPNSRWRSTTLKQIIDTGQKSNEQAYKDYIEGISKRRPMYGWKDYAPVLIAKWHPVIAAALEAYDIYQDPIHATHELAFLERMIGKTTKRSLDLIDSIFTPSNTTRGLIEGKYPEIPNKPSSDEDKKKMDQIRKMAANPDLLSENLEKSTKPIAQSAPNITQHLHLASNNALAFLASKLPQPNFQENPFGAKFSPSNAQVAKFNSYLHTVEDPLSALEQINNRTISPDTIETLMTVYPKLYQGLKQELLEKAYQHKEKGNIIPFQTRQAISTFIMEPIEQAMAPQAVLSNQQVYAMAQASKGNNPLAQSAPKERFKGLDKLDRSGRVEADYGAMDEKV